MIFEWTLIGVSAALSLALAACFLCSLSYNHDVDLSATVCPCLPGVSEFHTRSTFRRAEPASPSGRAPLLSSQQRAAPVAPAAVGGFWRGTPYSAVEGDGAADGTRAAPPPSGTFSAPGALPVSVPLPSGTKKAASRGEFSPDSVMAVGERAALGERVNRG